MNDPQDRIQLYAVQPEGPRRLDLPAGIKDVGEVFDRLPRGIYEALRTFDHVRFIGLAEHLARAERSMIATGLDGELGGRLDREALRRAIHATVQAYPGADCKLRLDVLAGPALELGSDSRLILALAPFEPPPPEAYRDGVGVGLVHARRDDPHVKSADWVVERRRLARDDADDYEPVMLDEGGHLLEGVQSNFFAVAEEALHTAGSGVLPGVTRGFVIALAREAGIPVVEEPVHEGDLAALEEAFMTTSVRSIIPVVRVAGVPLGDGRPGPITRGLMEAYAAFVAREARPASG